MRVKRNAHSFRTLVNAIKAGEVVVMACDTIYGLTGQVPHSENAILRMKRRPPSHPLLKLVADVESLQSLKLKEIDNPILSLWPGPFTFLFTGSDGTKEAFRIPDDVRIRELIREVGTPLYSTSVNRTGDAPMNDPSAIEFEFGDEVAVIEDAGILTGGMPSTIVDIGCRPVRILRQGAGVVPAGFL